MSDFWPIIRHTPSEIAIKPRNTKRCAMWIEPIPRLIIHQRIWTIHRWQTFLNAGYNSVILTSGRRSWYERIGRRIRSCEFYWSPCRRGESACAKTSRLESTTRNYTRTRYANDWRLQLQYPRVLGAFIWNVSENYYPHLLLAHPPVPSNTIFSLNLP